MVPAGIEAMAIEIVSFPIQNGVNFPYKSQFSHGFPMVFPLKMVDLSMVFGMFTRSGMMISWIHHPTSSPPGSYPLVNVDITENYHFFMGKPWENLGKMVIYMERSTIL